MAGPIHLLVPGTPVSCQSKRAALVAWKRKVASMARARVRTPVVDDELAVCITHFYKTLPRCDTDNMAKPICDAMNAIVYRDDWQIVECVARRIPLSRAFTLWDM
ncbi:MAG: RusA family crossover junction endodeoxyribonuclease, partial [Phycisphaerae bacterium]